MRKEEIIQMIKFGTVGVSNSVVTFLVFNFLIFFDVQYILANLLGYSLGMVNSYFWNHKYVFKKDLSTKNIIRFIVSNVAMMFFSTICLYYFVTILNVNESVAMLLSMMISMIINFLITKLWTFK